VTSATEHAIVMAHAEGRPLTDEQREALAVDTARLIGRALGREPESEWAGSTVEGSVELTWESVLNPVVDGLPVQSADMLVTYDNRTHRVLDCQINVVGRHSPCTMSIEASAGPRGVE